MTDIKLKSNWVIYDHEKSDSNTYEKCTRIVETFDSVISFWTSIGIVPVSELFYKVQNDVNKKDLGKPYYLYDNKKREISSISVFREGIEPKWEDDKNKNGGELSIRTFMKNNKISLDYVEEIFVKLVVFCISEESKYSNFLNGVRVIDSSKPFSKIPQYRIELWFSDETLKEKIQKEFITLLDLKSTDNVFFKSHKNDDGVTLIKN